MQVNFIAQPQEQLGHLLQACLSNNPAPTRVVIVSAFASLQAVLRLKGRLHELHQGGASVRLVVGVDMGGTSKEVLQELETWAPEVFIFKNRKSGVTFHPKLYVVEKPGLAEIFLGSNNLTDGGLYGNYEGAVRVTYELPNEAAGYAMARIQLNKFIEPAAPVGRRLDAAYLALLQARNDIPTDAESRRRRAEARSNRDPNAPVVDAFGFEPTAGPPQLPLVVQEVVIGAIRNQLDEISNARRQRRRGGAQNQVPEIDMRNFVPLAQINPTSFYLELTATNSEGENIPGEQRIPLEAINTAQEFWGWPHQYIEDRNPRRGRVEGRADRVYLNWKPVWRVYSVSAPADAVISPVRMYFYVNSSDFRFYTGRLSSMAKAGDMVRIQRVENEDFVYDCALAVAGTAEHTAWRALCTPASARSPRVFGFS